VEPKYCNFLPIY